MKLFIKIAIIFASFMLTMSSLNIITAFSMNTGYEIEALSEEEVQKRRPYLIISVKNRPSKGESILQFDINDEGKIALLTKEFGTGNTHINVYSPSGDFLYCFEYYDSGTSRCEWDSELLNIYSVRGSMIYSIDMTGSVLEIYEVPVISSQNRKYDNYLNLKIKSKDKVTYKMTNNLEFLNYFDGKASKFIIIDSDGETRVVYDSNPDRIIRIVLLIVLAVAFFSLAFLMAQKRMRDAKTISLPRTSANGKKRG